MDQIIAKIIVMIDLTEQRLGEFNAHCYFFNNVGAPTEQGCKPHVIVRVWREKICPVNDELLQCDLKVAIQENKRCTVLRLVFLSAYQINEPHRLYQSKGPGLVT